MIYAISVIKGIESLRGSMIIHICMAITMLVYVRIPDATVVKYSDGSEESIDELAGVDMWYIFAVAIHFLQALLIGLETHSKIIPMQVQTMLDSFEMLMVILQIINLIVIMTIYTTADPFATMTHRNKVLDFWVFVEGVMIIGTLITNI